MTSATPKLFLRTTGLELPLPIFLISSNASIVETIPELAPPGGSGLGLAIAKALVEAYGGSIRADSTPGKGTRMTVEFPISTELSSGKKGE